jgi:hypothetical protein
MDDGTLESEGMDYYDGIDLSEIDVNEWTHFSNNYSVEVPEQLLPILQKILVTSQNKYDNLDLDTGGNDVNYARIDVDIDTEKKEISVNYWYSYYATGGESSTTWNEEEDEGVKDVLKDIDELDSTETIMELKYNGSGDSGYIEGNFENGEEVPASVEDYCYGVLENMHGGWEINEGSQGTFYFDLEKREVTLEHQYNTEETDSHTLFEESFSK